VSVASSTDITSAPTTTHPSTIHPPPTHHSTTHSPSTHPTPTTSSIPTPTLCPTPPTADHTLSSTTLALLAESIPPNTRRAYDWAWRRFVAWCERNDRTPLPATAETITEHAAYLRAKFAAAATIDQALGVIGAMHRNAGHAKPDTEQARNIVRGLRRELAEAGVGPRQAPPLTRDVLQQVVASLDLDKPLGRRDQVLLVLGWMMMARRSELAALRFADIAEVHEGLDVTVRTSKTDHDSRGRRVALPAQKDPDLDPVRLVRDWRDEIGDDGHLLQRLDLRGRPAGPITGHGVNHAVHMAAWRAGVGAKGYYTAHSLRAGGLTDALLRGVPVGIAARHGGWEPTSPVVMTYARLADRWRHNAMRGAFK
jgi:integrase